MSLTVLGLLVILVIGDGLCIQLAVPSRNAASSASERSASGCYFNQNMYSKDDSKIRHMTTTLLDNDHSNSEKANAKSEPLFRYPAGLLEPLGLLEAVNPNGVFVEPISVSDQPAVVLEPLAPCSKSDGKEGINLIQPYTIPGFPVFETVSMYPQPQFPLYLPIPQPPLPAPILEVVPNEPVQILEEVRFSSPDSDAQESMLILENPAELPAIPAFPPLYPASAFYPAPFYPPGLYPFVPPQFPQ